MSGQFSPEWMEQFRAIVNRDGPFKNVGKHCNVRFLVGIGDQEYLVVIEKGRVETIALSGIFDFDANWPSHCAGRKSRGANSSSRAAAHLHRRHFHDVQSAHPVGGQSVGLLAEHPRTAVDVLPHAQCRSNRRSTGVIVRRRSVIELVSETPVS